MELIREMREFLIYYVLNEESALYYATITGSLDVVKYYLYEEKIDIMKEKYNPIVLAAAYDQVEIGKILIDIIKDVNYAHNKKHTLLMIAITNHSKKFIDFLLHHPDIDINREDNVFFYIFNRILIFIFNGIS